MAQLKDLIVNGATRLLGNAYASILQLTTLKAPTSAGGSTYGTGTSGQVLKTNGSTVYWADDMPPVYYVEGPSTDTTAGTWTGSIEGLTVYYDGLTIIYIPAIAGASTTTLNINGLGAKTCYYTNTSALTTHFSVGTPILLTYVNNAWRRADYDSNTNTLQRTYRSATNVELPIAGISTANSATAAYSAISSGSYKAVYGAIPETTANVATINPSTGKITIPGGINASNVYTKTEIDSIVGDVETLLAAI